MVADNSSTASGAPDAVELTAAQTWLLAGIVGAWAFPPVLALALPPTRQDLSTAPVGPLRDELVRLGVLGSDGSAHPLVAEWVQTAGAPERWFEIRFVRAGNDLLRGVLARRGTTTVAVLRNAQFVTFTRLEVEHPHELVPALVAGLGAEAPACFGVFSLPAKTGAEADARIRAGADPHAVLGSLGLPAAATAVAEAALTQPANYAEIVAAEHRNASSAATQVGIGVVDTALGRVVVSPRSGCQGSGDEWVSEFAPGTVVNIAAAAERLAGSLPGGRWFPNHTIVRNF